MFSKSVFEFLGELEQNNSKDWFEANRARYEADFKGAAFRFIEAVAPRMAVLEPALKAEARVNGSLRRVNRDVRFSKDKSPYDPRLHLVFWAGGHPNRSPAIHLVLHADGVGYGAGQFGLEPATLAKLRDRMMEPAELAQLEAAFESAASVNATIGEPELKRLPKGYEADGKLAEYLRHKAIVARTRGWQAKPEVMIGDGAVDWAMGVAEALQPLVRWLSR